MLGDAFVYKFDEKLDLKALERALKYLQWDPTKTLLEARIGDITIHIFENGFVRVFSKNKTFDELKESLLSVGMEIYGILGDIKKVLGLKEDVRDVMRGGHREKVGEVAFKMGALSGKALQGIIMVMYEWNEFQAERILVKAGESMGREMVKKLMPKDDKAMKRLLVRTIKDLGLGECEYVEMKDKDLFNVYKSVFSFGLPNINKKVCNFTRGLIRGFYCQFSGVENIVVKESKCWASGDTYCQFEVYSLAR